MSDTHADAGPHAEPAPESEPKRGGLRFLRDLVIIVVVALLASFLVKAYLVRSFYIPSASMQNTLLVGDRVLVNELVPGVVPLQRGDVVVFQDPGGWLGMGQGDDLIKRVIGLPGDTVECCNDFGQMSVNGVPLDEPYVNLPPGETRVSADDFSVTVPADSLWVMGDNRYNSKDSRYNGATPSKGFVPMSDVVGRAFVISWPTDRWTWLGDYPDVFRGTEREGE